MSEKFDTIINGDLKPLAEGILVTQLETGERKIGGIIIPDDDGKDNGIRPRWCKVYKIGSDIDEVAVGDWILVSHGRWSRGTKLLKSDGTAPVVRLVDRKDILLVTDQKPETLA